jgi:hypothetical protein
MNFLHFYPVETDDGDVIVVNLSGAEANVIAMDDDNFRSYRSGRSVKHYGGHYTQSPAVIKPPSGSWHVTVDTGGFPGKVSASVRVVSGSVHAR